MFPSLIARYFQLQIGVQWDWAAAAQGLVAGLLTTLLFTLPPLLSIRRVHPGLVLRREMPESKPGWRARLADAKPSLLAAGLILCGLGGIAAWLSGGTTAGDGIRMGVYFIGGIVASLLTLAAVAWALLRTLRAFLRTAFAARLPANLRHGMANLYRPGNQAQTVLVALGLGVMFSLTIYLVQHSMLADIARSAPPGMPNVFMVGITEAQKDAVRTLLATQPGVEGAAEIVPYVAVRLVTVNGTPIGSMVSPRVVKRFLQTRSASWSASKPDYTDVVQGAWWTGGRHAQVSVAEEAAKILNVQPGSRMQFTAFGRNFDAEVACVHRSEAIRIGSASEFIFDPGYAGWLAHHLLRRCPRHARRRSRSAARRVRKVPTVSVVNAADVLQIVQDVVDQIAVVIRFISLFTILAGVIILASSVAGTRFRRIREVVILKTLGATREGWPDFLGRVPDPGAVAGLIGSLLATGFSGLLLNRFFEGRFRFDLLPNLLAVG